MSETGFANLGRSMLGSPARCAMLLASAFTLINSSIANGSVVIPQPVTFNSSDFVQANASGAGVAGRNSPSIVDPYEHCKHVDKKDIFDNLNSPSNTSTSGSSVPDGGGSSNSPAIGPVINSNLRDAALVAWMCSTERISLPMPPGNELLRPPKFA